MILKMDTDAVIQVQDITTSLEWRIDGVQKLNGYMDSCSEVRKAITALIPENEVVEEAQTWIDYQRAIDNALDIAQEYISNQSIPPRVQQNINNHI